MSNRFPAEVLEILPVGDEAMDEAKGAFSRLRCDRFYELVENAFSYDAEKLADLPVGNFAAGVSDGLLEERESVAKAAFRMFFVTGEMWRDLAWSSLGYGFGLALAIVLGNEATGLSDAWAAPDVESLRLPMLGVADSLNVAVAGAVLLYEARRQRDGQPR